MLLQIRRHYSLCNYSGTFDFVAAPKNGPLHFI